MNAETVVSLRDVSVQYGKRVAVDTVSLTVAGGAIYALLGRNGAGKSSLVSAMLGFRPPNSGTVEVLGDNVWPHRAKLMDRIGVVAEVPDAPSEMRVGSLERFSSGLYSRWDASSFDERMRRVGIRVDSRFGELSKGQKKQVMLALALASSPDLVVLDDPTLGLDAVARKWLFEEVIGEMADRGLTVFLTTHDLAGVDLVADRVGILESGRLVLDEDMETLKSRFRRIRVPDPPPVLAASPLVTAAIRKWGTGTEAIVSNYDELSFDRFQEGANVVAEVSPLTLEEIFLAVAGQDPGGES
jgi:ABC-type multidrug transport system ATPase subunit